MYSLLRRFKDVFKKSRVSYLTRQNMRYEKPINKARIKKDALRRKYNREKRQYQIRVGEISEEPIIQGRQNKKR